MYRAIADKSEKRPYLNQTYITQRQRKRFGALWEGYKEGGLGTNQKWLVPVVYHDTVHDSVHHSCIVIIIDGRRIRTQSFRFYCERDKSVTLCMLQSITSLSHRRCHPISNSDIHQAIQNFFQVYILEDIGRFITSCQSHNVYQKCTVNIDISLVVQPRRSLCMAGSTSQKKS